MADGGDEHLVRVRALPIAHCHSVRVSTTVHGIALGEECEP